VIGAGGIGAELSYLSMVGTSPARSPARRAAIVSPFGSSCASKVACDAPVTSKSGTESRQWASSRSAISLSLEVEGAVPEELPQGLVHLLVGPLEGDGPRSERKGERVEDSRHLVQAMCLTKDNEAAPRDRRTS
jgi:hypothetical protein